MTPPPPPSSIDLDFISVRHKLLDVAAFLDRVERENTQVDFRVQSLKRALPLLDEAGGQRTKSILEHFSDLTEAPLDHAPGKGACGTVPPQSES